MGAGGSILGHNRKAVRLGGPAMQRIFLIPVLLAGSLMAAAQAAPAASPVPAGTATAATPAPATASNPTLVIPEGTRVLLELRSGVNTRSAQPGDGVYLASTFPVVVGNRVVIPAGVYVQGVVDSVVRPGRIHGKAQLNMHFTSMIFPNGSVVEIPGIVNSLPGAKNQQVKNNEGTIEQDGGSNKAHNAEETAKIAVPSGTTLGSVGGLESGHPIAGGIAGMGAGLAAAGVVALFTRGADVNIPEGTKVEMVLQRPLVIEESNLVGPATPVPANAQPAPARGRPVLHVPPQMVCPAGSLGCNN